MRRVATPRPVRVAAALAMVLALVSGCGTFGGLYGVPLPGGADLGEHPYRVTAEFTDVLDLVPQSGVRVNDVAAGTVESIALSTDGRTAEVTMLLNRDVALPANAVARLRQSSMLGEKFVELAAPDEPRGTLTDGARIDVARTSRNTEIEEVLGALSMVLNGGGVSQLKDINTELNAAMAGNTGEIRSLLRRIETFTASFDKNSDVLTKALHGTDKLAARLAERKDKIAALVEDLEPGIAVLADQREKLTTMLTSLDRLSDVAVETVDRSGDNLVADLRALEPTLRNLAEAGEDLPAAMEMLLTFPFPDSALPAIKGDYINLYIEHHAAKGGR
ncbi:MCE family protein [Haloechinothrix halophila]|uniref:MCE family protein n=1 Tax=Haloechinothrix halophila TaxID=1069073 RepID=UPI00068698E9|nr:MCE family protein [Haloechinothrix halophila]